MDEYDEVGTGPEHLAGHSAGETLWAFLTPQASAITGFTLAVLALTGQGIWTQAVQSLWLPSYPEGSVAVVLASGSGATLLVAIAALVLSRRAIGPTAGAGWHEHLGRAGAALAALAVGLSALALLLGLLRTV